MTSADDEIRMLRDGWRLLGGDVQAELLARGWEVTDLGVDDDAALEFFWPPTAPIGYGEPQACADPAMLRRSGLRADEPTPWIRPTRITRVGAAWQIDFGEAIAQAPDIRVLHSDDSELLDDLPRIEWWPMTVAEARRTQNERVLHTTHADAYDQHSLGCSLRTEPYESRLKEVHERIRSTTTVMLGDPAGWKWAGDLSARARIIDGEMWASAVRTARAGGAGWDTSGPHDAPEE